MQKNKCFKTHLLKNYEELKFSEIIASFYYIKKVKMGALSSCCGNSSETDDENNHITESNGRQQNPDRVFN